jgi:hypothetical protein
MCHMYICYTSNCYIIQRGRLQIVNILFDWHDISGITFMYTPSKKWTARYWSNINIFGSKKTKGYQLGSQNQLRSHISRAGEP